jgi:capsular exopolysaccharide synthesis family protein
MSKTQKSLSKAEKEHHNKSLPSVVKPNLLPVLWDLMHGVSPIAPDWFKDLKIRIDLSHNGRPPKSILFTSTSLKSGCSSVAAGFAKCLSVSFQKRVLLIDVNIRNQNLCSFFGNEYIKDIEELLADNSVLFPNLKDDVPRNLQVIHCSSQPEEMINLITSDQFNLLLSSAREVFDYIILDSSPVTQSSETRVICAKVDGVVLIVEAGKTRRQVALKAKDEIERSGGIFLGSVLNKRKFYIPNWLYRRL